MLCSVVHLESDNIQNTTQLFIMRYLVPYCIFRIFRSKFLPLCEHKELRTDGRTDIWKDGQTDRVKTYMPPTVLSKSDFIIDSCTTMLGIKCHIYGYFQQFKAVFSSFRPFSAIFSRFRQFSVVSGNFRPFSAILLASYVLW